MSPRGRSPDTLLSPNSLLQGSIREGEKNNQGDFPNYGNAIAAHRERFWLHYYESHFISPTQSTQDRGTHHTLTQSYHSFA